ncbi:hypothetical protein KIH74_01435 [Kineosporia sp. J2-2]|uniref:Uncharacterized protein n=1 Tax=Kineosporia corallincola TaxID=2835133 RepID=A0ABS5T929_9ACTN|nr:hypothetical protein [Kineosporia corallincola]MBT0767566.1 hypothetical protein [Kineosporia corallincola]
MPTLRGPGVDDRFDPAALDDVRERVVLPVLEAVLRPGELERMELGQGPGQELLLRVMAAGRTWHGAFWFGPEADPEETLGEVAYYLADRLEDWVCEDVAWGEQRIAEVRIPARRRPVRGQRVAGRG